MQDNDYIKIDNVKVVVDGKLETIKVVTDRRRLFRVLCQ